ncbi:hypothetical protein [Frateuria sp. YIM B11624]
MAKLPAFLSGARRMRIENWVDLAGLAATLLLVALLLGWLVCSATAFLA